MNNDLEIASMLEDEAIAFSIEYYLGIVKADSMGDDESDEDDDDDDEEDEKPKSKKKTSSDKKDQPKEECKQ